MVSSSNCGLEQKEKTYSFPKGNSRKKEPLQYYCILIFLKIGVYSLFHLKPIIYTFFSLSFLLIRKRQVEFLIKYSSMTNILSFPFCFIIILVSSQVNRSMDNRGNNRDSDRDRDRNGSDNRRGNNDRGGDRDRDERDQRRDAPSSSSSQQRRTEEEETTYYRSQIAPRSTNITTNRVVPASNNIIMERFYSYGAGAGVPLKPGGKSAAVVAIQ